jgi:inosine-uridine nucleoside N-ribohydrolase
MHPGWRAGPVETATPSTSLGAGSSRRLKHGSAEDDAARSGGERNSGRRRRFDEFAKFSYRFGLVHGQEGWMSRTGRGIVLWSLSVVMFSFSFAAVARGQSPSSAAPQKIIIDTDIGDDIDDAFALALAVKSPELQVLGVTTGLGDTEARARITDRFLGEIGRADIPVLAGVATATKNQMPQRRYGDGGPFVKNSHANAVDFLLEQIRKYPGEITLIAIGPLMNVGGAIDKDAATFRKLKRVVLMGGSVRRGYGELGYTAHVPPMPEWNILNDVASAQKLFASGVPVYVMPLDSTQLKMDEVKRAWLFSQGTPVTDQLAILYHLWGQETPTLFDPMTLAYAVKPELCPVTGMHLRVDEKGSTIEEPGPVNAQVCLDSNSEDFFRFYLKRVGAR